MKCKYCKEEMDIEDTEVEGDMIEILFTCNQCDIEVVENYKPVGKPKTMYYDYLGYRITKEAYEKILKTTN